MSNNHSTRKLSINKHTKFLQRLPETRLSNQIDKNKANWIIFSDYLSNELFEGLDSATGQYNPVVSVWSVGQYEVALMAGVLTPQHKEVLFQLNADCASLDDLPDLSKPGLVVFDMDSTAIQIECIDEIAKLAGVGEKVSEVTERAMQGELDFEQSLRERVAQLKDADEGILQQVRETLPMMPDLRELIEGLKSYGWKTAIASGGFTYFSDYLKQELALDHAQSNQLEIVDGKLTGNVLGGVVSAQTKAEILEKLATDYAIEPSNTVAVGDGANDLVMMSAAGLGIAFHAKPKVEQQAQTSVRFAGLGGVLCILSASLAKQQKLGWNQAK